MSQTERIVPIDPQRVAIFLLVLMGLVLLASVVTQSLFHLSGDLSWRRIAMFLDVSRERNVPTAFSTCLLLLAASLTACVSVLEFRRPDRLYLYWAFVAAALFVMAIDEAFSFHEKFNDPMRELLGREKLGLLFNAWVLPVFAIVLVLAPVFIAFLRRIPRATALQFAVAGGLFVFGALGLETLEGRFDEANNVGETTGRPSIAKLQWHLICAVEEMLEMTAVILYIRALLRYVAGSYPVLNLRFGASKAG